MHAGRPRSPLSRRGGRAWPVATQDPPSRVSSPACPSRSATCSVRRHADTPSQSAVHVLSFSKVTSRREVFRRHMSHASLLLSEVLAFSTADEHRLKGGVQSPQGCFAPFIFFWQYSLLPHSQKRTSTRREGLPYSVRPSNKAGGGKSVVLPVGRFSGVRSGRCRAVRGGCLLVKEVGRSK